MTLRKAPNTDEEQQQQSKELCMLLEKLSKKYSWCGAYILIMHNRSPANSGDFDVHTCDGVTGAMIDHKIRAKMLETYAEVHRDLATTIEEGVATPAKEKH